MKKLLTIDLHNYETTWPLTRREASKAVFFIDGKLVMLQSKVGDVKFIGGGIEAGESRIDCLVREVMEESGFRLKLESVLELGEITERRKDKYADVIWEMVNYLYYCEVDLLTRQEVSLTQNETACGMHCVMLTPQEAISMNEKVMQEDVYVPWLERDLKVLKLLFEEGEFEKRKMTKLKI